MAKVIGKTCNQIQVATQLDSISDPTPSQQAIINTILGLSIPEAQAALDEISGIQHFSDFYRMELSNRQFIRRLYDPLRPIVTREPCACCETDNYSCCDDGYGYNNGIEAWIEGSGGHSTVSGRNHHTRFNMNSWEVSVGAQKTFCQDITLGIAGSYEFDRLRYKACSFGRAHTWLGGIYALYRPCDYYVLADLAYGYSENNLRRRLNTFGVSAKSKPRISQLTFYTEGGVDFSWNCLLIQPFVGVEVDSFWRRRVTEHGAGDLDLIVDKKNRTWTSSRLGVHLTSAEVFGFDVSVDLAWLYRFKKNRLRLNERFETFGSEFTLLDTDRDRNSGEAAITISKTVLENFTVYAEAYGEIWRHSGTYNILGGLQYSW